MMCLLRCVDKGVMEMIFPFLYTRIMVDFGLNMEILQNCSKYDAWRRNMLECLDWMTDCGDEPWVTWGKFDT
ncbi:hypothetical protein Pcinc_038185 [Petrolisthes cinctipes]|uniref:Uncharacterized protein n=1 Tax=Petrolisthes cinctipes TaxID=88211 RepID=A0AAE1BR70_PETCI|nr:hypothetical protein Pcinc_038185 [Petrolisthes cinctipes]